MSSATDPVVPTVANRFKAVLILRGETVKGWARQRRFTESLVWMNLSGDRCTDDIRDAVAVELGISRRYMDRLIERERKVRAA